MGTGLIIASVVIIALVAVAVALGLIAFALLGRGPRITLGPINAPPPTPAGAGAPNPQPQANTPGAPAPGTNTNSFQAYVGWWLFSKTLWVALLVLAIITLLLLFHVPILSTSTWSWATDQYGSIPLWTILVGVAIASLTLWYFDKMRTKFAVTVSAAIFVILVFELFKHGQLEEGMRRPILYAIAIALSFALVEIKEGRLAFAFSLAAFGILGISHLTDYQGAISYLSSLGGSSGTRQATSTSNIQCSGNWEVVDLTNTSAADINRNGACKVQIKAPGKCVYLRHPAWKNDPSWYGPYCDDGQRLQMAPDYMEYAASVDGSFKALVQLNP